MRDRDAHLTEAEVAGWQDLSLGGDDLVAVSDHLASCATCRARCQDRSADEVALEMSLLLSEEERAPNAGDRSPWLRWAAAALVAIAVGAIGFSARLGLHPGASPGNSGGAANRAGVVLHDGARTITWGPGDALAGVPDAWRVRVADALSNPDLEPPPIAARVQAAPEQQRGPIRAPAEAVTLEQPRSHVILSASPTFSWTGPAGGSYRVEVYDQRSSDLVARATVAGTSWAATAPLPRGTVLVWTVRSLSSGTTFPCPPDPPARFAVASAESAEDIASARATGSKLLLGLALWSGGLVDEAADELAELARENPGSPVAQRLASASARGAAPSR
jgi:hypothetical protein